MELSSKRSLHSPVRASALGICYSSWHVAEEEEVPRPWSRRLRGSRRTSSGERLSRLWQRGTCVDLQRHWFYICMFVILGRRTFRNSFEISRFSYSEEICEGRSRCAPAWNKYVQVFHNIPPKNGSVSIWGQWCNRFVWNQTFIKAKQKKTCWQCVHWEFSRNRLGFRSYYLFLYLAIFLESLW